MHLTTTAASSLALKRLVCTLALLAASATNTAAARDILSSRRAAGAEAAAAAAATARATTNDVSVGEAAVVSSSTALNVATRPVPEPRLRPQEAVGAADAYSKKKKNKKKKNKCKQNKWKQKPGGGGIKPGGNHHHGGKPGYGKPEEEAAYSQGQHGAYTMDVDGDANIDLDEIFSVIDSGALLRARETQHIILYNETFRLYTLFACIRETETRCSS